ncbi:tRNA1(Val) (adenine(37)-N6)-methyltransferase [Amorphus sp. MBR-141]
MSGAAPVETAAERTVDRFLSGAFAVIQAARGAHRCGSDAILLAAMLPSDTHGHVVDLGAGPGAAGFSVACRTAARVSLVDVDSQALAFARDSLALPENAGFADRVALCLADVGGPAAPFEAAGLAAGTVDHVVANPPFFRPGVHRAAPSPDRARARMLGADGLAPWLRRAASLLRTGGSLNLILPTELLPQVIAGVDGRFGALDVLPVHPRAGSAADRVLVRGVKASRAGLRIVPGLVMHDGDGAYSAAARGILRAGEAIAWPPR